MFVIKPTEIYNSGVTELPTPLKTEPSRLNPAIGKNPSVDILRYEIAKGITSVGVFSSFKNNSAQKNNSMEKTNPMVKNKVMEEPTMLSILSNSLAPKVLPTSTLTAPPNPIKKIICSHKGDADMVMAAMLSPYSDQCPTMNKSVSTNKDCIRFITIQGMENLIIAGRIFPFVKSCSFIGTTTPLICQIKF